MFLETFTGHDLCEANVQASLSALKFTGQDLPTTSREIQQDNEKLQREFREIQEREEVLQRRLREMQEREEESRRQLRDTQQREENAQRQLREVEQREENSQRRMQQREENLQRQLREMQQSEENSQREMQQREENLQRQLREMQQSEENSQREMQQREENLQRQLREMQQSEENSQREMQQREENLQRQLREMQQSEENSQREMQQREENLQRQLREMQQSGVNSQRLLREVQQREENLQRQLTEMQQRENSQDQVSSLERQLREKDQEINELELSLSLAQRRISEQRRQETCDWVISRDEILITDNCLGMGGWGSVNEGTYCGCTVAVKQIHDLILSRHNRLLFEREMNIASACRHPCLLQFIGATNDEGSPLFVTELMEKSLRALFEERPLSETEIRIISLDVARALNYLHQKKPSPIIHRDVSSANVLLWRQGDQWRGKVSDYGTANFIQQTMTVAPGAAIYCAPEAHTSNQTVKVGRHHRFQGPVFNNYITDRVCDCDYCV